MLDTQNIIIKWIERNEHYQKVLDRQEVMAVFEGLAIGFSGDNEISEKLVEIIPEVEEIKINKDINATQEIPCITYVINGKVEVLKIIRYHKIVWAILNKYCSK